MMQAHLIRSDLPAFRLIPLAAVLSLVLVGLLAVAQPGLCPCWMFTNSMQVHPHPYGHAELPHDHSYLFDMSPSSPSQPPPILIAPQEVIDRLLALGGLWSASSPPVLGMVGWSIPPSTPPPRLQPLH